MLLLDASAAVALLINAPKERVDALRARLRGESVHAPYLLDLEVTQAICNLLLRGFLDLQRATACVRNWQAVPLTRHPHLPFLARVWALRGNLTAFDAAYVALAEGMEAPLLTLDRRLGLAPGHSAVVETF
ncbi:MAG: type II toxin-antitoxin system VapC family toxin [Chloroflexi bacterium]|nr:type II toxin-antitoxin system VapC family toxin [Chloroflexota bacterium]